MSDDFKAVLKEMFSKRAEEIRTEKGLSQEEMAELLHVTPRAYNDLKQGRYCFPCCRPCSCFRRKTTIGSWIFCGTSAERPRRSNGGANPLRRNPGGCTAVYSSAADPGRVSARRKNAR